MKVHSVIGLDKIGSFDLVNTTTISLAVSRVTIGGLQYDTDFMTATTTDIDTGSVSNLAFYYAYVVISSGVPKLVFSLNNQKPAGVVAYKKVGAFYTDSSGDFFKAYSAGKIVKGHFSARTSGTNVVLESGDPTDFMENTFSQTGGNTQTFTYRPNIFAQAPLPNPTIYSNALYRIVQNLTYNETGFSILTGTDSGTGAYIPVTFDVFANGVDAIQPDWKDY